MHAAAERPATRLLDRRGADLLAVSVSGPLWALILWWVGEVAEVEAIGVAARLLLLILPLLGVAVAWRRAGRAEGPAVWAWALVAVALLLPLFMGASVNTVPAPDPTGFGCVRAGVLPQALDPPLQRLARHLSYAAAPLAAAALACLARRDTRAAGAWALVALLAMLFTAFAAAVTGGCPHI